MDTANFSKEADKARQLDYDMASLIESRLGIVNSHENRLNLFNELIQARSDVSTLNSYQILLKDMKIITNKSRSKVVALPGYPMLVSEYIQLEDVIESIRKFSENYNTDLILMIGLKFTGNKFERDICLVKGKNMNLFKTLLNNLIESKDPNFNFVEHFPDEKSLNLGVYYKQNNVKLTRKQIVPIVKQVLDELN